MTDHLMDDADKYLIRQAIASSLDHPSVYMGGPSRQSVRRAINIVRMLLAEYEITPAAQSRAEADIVRTWRKSPWDSMDDLGEKDGAR